MKNKLYVQMQNNQYTNAFKFVLIFFINDFVIEYAFWPRRKFVIVMLM